MQFREQFAYILVLAAVVLMGFDTSAHAQYRGTVQKSESQRIPRPSLRSSPVSALKELDSKEFDLHAVEAADKQREGDLLTPSSAPSAIESLPMPRSTLFSPSPTPRTPETKPESPVSEDGSGRGTSVENPRQETAQQTKAVGVVSTQTPPPAPAGPEGPAKLIIVGFGDGTGTTEYQDFEALRSQYAKNGALFINKDGTIFNKDGSWCMDKDGQVYDSPDKIQQHADNLGKLDTAKTQQYIKENNPSGELRSPLASGPGTTMAPITVGH